MKKKIRCRQCGQPFQDRACGPSHALVAAELRDGPYGKVRLSRLKQRVARILWELPGARRKINEAIEEWADKERRRS